MAKNYSNRNKKRKALIAMLCALSVTCTGLAAACTPNEEETPSTAVTAKEDVQLLKNGNFEHFDIPDKAIHLIKSVNSWSLGGDSSVKSGIIGTSKEDWDKLTDPELAGTLDYNNDLSADNENYVNYNSMRSRDIPYRDTYSATLEKTDDSWVTKHEGGYEGYFDIQGNDNDGYTWNGKEAKKIDGEFYIKDENGDFTKLIRKELIDNPGTHYDLNENETKITVDGKEYDVLKNEESGNLYYKDGDGNENYFGNVLMIHNAPTDSNNNGIQQYYTSNTVSLEAHTSAEISLWVKTSDLRFDKGSFATADEEDKGAYIEVVQTVANTTVDSFKIKSINTQNIIASAEKEGKTTTESNGWVKYTIYVNACDFANTSIQLKLGLGGSPKNEGVTGYAFFDDVQVTKYRDLGAEDCTYDATKVTNTTCTLTSEEDEKIFYADVTTKWSKDLHPYDFHYLVDLASVTDKDNQQHTYEAIPFGSSVQVGLTTEKDSKDVEYAAAKKIDANTKIDVVTKKNEPTDGYKLPKDLKDKARPTNEDIITVWKNGDAAFSGKYANLLNNVTGDNRAPEDNGNTLLMFSAWGAPYTATITNEKFTLQKDAYLLVSFWVKTSDMDGDKAATAKIYELDSKGLVDEGSVKTLTVDTTDKTTDFEDEKDIYKGWVQCFFFVKNDADDAKEFKIDFSFGATAITTTSSYKSGFAAIANLQTLTIDEDIYKLASAGDNTALFAFTKDTDSNSSKAFDEATGVNDVSEGLARPDSYTGVNGGNVLGSLTNKNGNKNDFVNAGEKLNAGLVNRDVFIDSDNEYAMSQADKDKILHSFVSGATSWDEVFGKNCYQPLIIINNLREYAQRADANKENYKDYWTKNEDGIYTKVAATDEYKEDETYYSLAEVANYGFIGGSKTVSSNGREVISVRVKVTGDAVAYIYLVDSDDTDKVLSFTTPSYTYWYDEEGNVLDEELDEDWTTAKHREHIVYTLREDGLYEDKYGKLFANLNNLVKSYKDSKYEGVAYYDENGKPVEGGYDYVEKYGDGKTYYKTEAGKAGQVADHYLCTTDGTHVYECIDGKYYYVEITKTDDKTTETTNRDKEVNNFDTKPRYTYPEIAEELVVKVTADDCIKLGDKSDLDLSDAAKETAPGWVTVNFVVKAGSENKSYRLALWSGDRNETGVDENGDYKSGAVAFDYVHGTVSESRLGAYEAEIVNAYNRAIIEVNNEINVGKDDEHKVDLFKDLASGTDVNIDSYKTLIAGLDEEYRNKINAKLTEYGYLDDEGKPTYTASYYTYTLYDSAAYVPFNATTAGDGETGYDYDAASFKEQLAFFKFDDQSRNEKNVFVDYTAVDQSITKNTVDNGDDDEDEEATNNTAELGLYISSIVLVVVLLITLVSILLTQYIRKRKKAKGAKNSEKNAYRKRDRYVKKLHLVKDEMVEPEPTEDATGEVPAEEVTPAPGEDTTETAETVDPAETEEPASPAEEATEATEPAETEEPAEKTDGEDKE